MRKSTLHIVAACQPFASVEFSTYDDVIGCRIHAVEVKNTLKLLSDEVIEDERKKYTGCTYYGSLLMDGWTTHDG